MDRHTICILIVGALVVAVIYFYSKEHFASSDLFLEPIETPLDVQYIEGTPDLELIDGTGNVLLPPGDMALNPGFGVGPGTFGFGRYGLGFMA
jgi:hypothetical protein